MCLLDVFCICLFVFLVCTKQQYPNLGGYCTVSRKASDMIDSEEQFTVHINYVYNKRQRHVILLMEEIMHQSISN